MQKNSVNPDFVPSLVGGTCLSDILLDLPLPTHVPTPTEHSLLFSTTLKDESSQLLQNTNKDVVRNIVSVIERVKMDYFKFKGDMIENNPLAANSQLPPLVERIVAQRDANPYLILDKLVIDGNVKYSSPTKTVGITTPQQTLNDSFRVPQVTPHAHSKQRQATSVSSSPISACILTTGSLNTPKGTVKRQRRISSRDDNSTPVQTQQFQGLREINSLTVSVDLKRLSHKPSAKLKKQHGAPRRSSTSDELLVSIPRKYFKPMQVVPSTSPPEVTVPRGYKVDDASLRPKKKKKKALLEATDPLQSEVYCRYLSMVEHFEHAVEQDIHSLLSVVEERGLPSEISLPGALVYQLLTDTVALKNQKLLHLVPEDSLLNLINILQLHVLDCKSLKLNILPDGMGSEDFAAWREMSIERILRGLDAALIILHIGTYPKISQRVHQDEAYDRVVAISRFHLETNVYPEFDPIYKAGVDSNIGIKAKRRYAGGPGKHIYPIYQKLTEILDALSHLLMVQNHTDTFVLQVSTVGIMPFFVENVSTLQLSAMKLIRSVYSKYEKHRDLIMEDIFASLARLPTSKKSMRTYKLSGGQCIQMVTALVLQMVQCIVINPRKEDTKTRFHMENGNEDGNGATKEEQIDMELMMSFTTASNAAKTFLSTFMKKCCAGGKDDDDFKPLFEGFVQDLLVTLHLPEWPAAELLLMLLGGLLTQSFTNKSNDAQIRLLSLEHMGTIAARLRKDAVSCSEEDNDTIVNVLSQVLQCKIDAKPTSPIGIGNLDAFSENTQHLQRALVSFLNRRSQFDPASTYARDFCIGQWMSDLYSELERFQKTNEEEGSSDEKLQEEAQSKKKFLRSLLKVKASEATRSLEGILTEHSSMAVVRFLASSRSLSKSFDYLLKQLLMVLKDSAVHVRTKAMKALSTVVSVDPSILSRNEVCHSIQYHIADGSALVREAAVELLGKFVLNQPDLVLQYYDMLIVRMLDTSVSVRKRVIKIFKDICLQEHFPKQIDVYGKMLRRIGDEEGVKNLVANVFQSLWFTIPQTSAVELDKEIQKRVTGIMGVLSSDELVHEYFELLLQHLLKGEKSSHVKSLMSAYQMMVDVIVKMILALDENEGGVGDPLSDSSITLTGCVTALYLFSKVDPSLLVNHATTIQPYLSIKCTSENDVMVVVYITRILEKVVPLMAHPDGSFLSSIEEEMVKLILKQGPNVLQACIGCMDAVANKVTRNYKLVVECFQKFYMFLEKVRMIHSRDKNSQLGAQRSLLLRSLYVVSLMCKHFDFNEVAETSPLPHMMLPVKSKVFELLMYFTAYDDDEVCLKAVSGLGFFCVRYPHCMLEKDMKEFYLNWLGPDSGMKKKLQILRNLLFHFSEDEARWKEQHTDNEDTQGEDSEALADLGDQLSLVNSQIAQCYCGEVFNCYLNHAVDVRLAVMHIVSIILKLGLVPPPQCVPWLITMTTDQESTISVKACQWISDLDSRYGGFTQNQLMSGAKNSYEFQRLLGHGIVRGCTEEIGDPQSLLAHVYTLLRGSKQKRRPFLRTIINQFTDPDKNSLNYLLYLADNLAYFPYNLIKEPLFVIHEVDMALSVHGASVYQKFRDALSLGHDEEDDNDTLDVLSQRQCDQSKLNSCCDFSQSCFLLLNLSQHLKLCYNLNDSKCSKYNPSESTKLYDKATNRKVGVLFNPSTVVEHLRRKLQDPTVLSSQEDCLLVYIQFKKLMNSMDPFEDKMSPEPMDVLPTKPVPTSNDGDGVEQAGDRGEVEQSSDIAQSLEQPIQKKGRARLSSSGSNGSGGTRKTGRTRRGSADSITKSCTKKRRKLSKMDSDSDQEDPENV